MTRALCTQAMAESRSHDSKAAFARLIRELKGARAILIDTDGWMPDEDSNLD